ncbi:bacteriocin immunity protein [Kluyvera ascorbata]|uniref:bacteriocin immunity protein n=1 Tax=Kluyvera ascorbata TaxID=51288 RepID=UPI00056BC378|nr:bacteriocin immunity protein [Kluyvera ascorbata]MDU1197956.1 bacteriocin immunity protein [Kluyvera ascorbata]
MSKLLSDYTKSDFISLVAEIIGGQGTEAHQDELLELFIQLTEHPEGSDLIYYPQLAAEATPEAIADKVQAWRKANGKPSYKVD